MVEFLRTCDHPERLDEIVELLVEANVEHPPYDSMFLDEKTRRNIVAWLYKKRLCLLGESSQFWLDENGVQGHLVCVRHSNMDPSIFTLIYHGFLELPFRCGWSGFLKFNTFLDIMKEVHPKGSGFWVLEAFAIRKDKRCQGIGSKVLQQLYDERVKDSHFILMCQTEGGKRLYERHGFAIHNHRMVTLTEGMPFNNWVMEANQQNAEPIREKDKPTWSIFSFKGIMVVGIISLVARNFYTKWNA